MRRIVIPIALALLALLPFSGEVAAKKPPAAAKSPPDYTFRFRLTPPASPLGSWTVSGAPATPVRRRGATIVNGDASGSLATVSSWTPGTNQLQLDLNFRNIGSSDAAGSTLVVDMISPAWDMTLNPSGGFTLGTQATTDLFPQSGTSYGYLFGERLPAGPMPAGATTTVRLGLGIGNPGAIPAPRYDVYYHIETDETGATVRHGLPYEGTLPKINGKLVAPPGNGRYLVLDTIGISQPNGRWADRFQAKYNQHPTVFQFIGADRAMDVQTIQSYVDSINLAASRGMMAGIQLGIGTVGSQGTWTWQEIIDGVHDDFITKLATAIRDLGYPVIGFLGEEYNASLGPKSCGADGKQNCSSNATFTAGDANAYGDPTYPDAPERFRDAARHIVDLFDQAGATNVTYIIMPNNSSYDTRVFPYDMEGTSNPWWDDAKYWYPGADYLDITSSQIYNSWPNPAGVAFAYPPLTDQINRHKNGYRDWTALAPSNMFGLPDFLPATGTFPGQNGDRSAMIREWYAAFDQFPQLRYLSVYENGVENGICAPVSVYCLANPAVWNVAGLADYGFYHPEEIDAFREGEAGARFVQRPYFSSDKPPSTVTDLSAKLGDAPGQVVLKWTPPSTGTIDHYTLKSRTDGNLTASTWSRFDTSTLVAPAPNDSTTLISGLAAGTYTFAIKATNAAHQNSPISNTVTITVP